MNNLVKTLSVVVLSICFALTAHAGEGKKEKRKAKMADRIISHLQLDEGRANEVRVIFKEASKARKALTDKRGEEAKALRANMNDKLAAILTPQEMEEIVAMKKKDRKKNKKWKKEEKKNKSDA